MPHGPASCGIDRVGGTSGAVPSSPPHPFPPLDCGSPVCSSLGQMSPSRKLEVYPHIYSYSSGEIVVVVVVVVVLVVVVVVGGDGVALPLLVVVLS